MSSASAPQTNGLSGGAAAPVPSDPGPGGSSGIASASSAPSLEPLCLELRSRVDAFLARDTTNDPVLRSTQAQVVAARQVVDDALRRYTPDQLSLSYNGGKDCLVLLILILASLPGHFPAFPSLSPSSAPGQSAATPASASEPAPFPTSIQALYIRPPSPFPEVDAFVDETTALYHLDLATSNDPMKPALTHYLANTRPSIRAVFVGTRRTDPHGANLTAFDPTDPGWPDFMRIHPVIDWHYREIWSFIRALEIPYCPLYDMGYTSLGGTDDTYPNPALKKASTGPTEKEFSPAYELMEDDEERLGRDK